MSTYQWTITDVAEDIYEDEYALTPEVVGGPAEGYAIAKTTLRGGLREGVDVIRVDNGAMLIDVLPTRGMGIWKAWVRDETRDDPIEIGWQPPLQGPVHPNFVPLMEPSGLGWLDGFDELLVRCGLESNGAPDFNENGQLVYPLHGRIANKPAHRTGVEVDSETGKICVTGEVDETRLFFNKMQLATTISTNVGQTGFRVVDEVTNISAQPGELQLLYHINFGAPLSVPGSKLVVPVARLAPRDPVAVENLDEWDLCGPESTELGEAVFFFELAADDNGRTKVLLKNPAGDLGVSLSLNKSQLPRFIVWKNRQAAADGYVTGLEPAINFPNARSFEKEKGRVAELAPGESRTFEIAVEVHVGGDAVAQVEAEIGAIQEATEPEYLAEPDPEWSA